jgi:hypothetical protein
MDNKFKLSDAIKCTFDIEWSFEIATPTKEFTLLYYHSLLQ